MALFGTRDPAAPKPADRRASGYRRHRIRTGAVQAEASRRGRDIGEIPPVENPKRRARCEKSFRRHCETYHPDRFYLPWSSDHLTAIARAEAAAFAGELFALAMPRGGGKTSLAEVLVEWAALNGHRRFIPLIGADEAHAVGMLENIKAELEENDRLLADYPEVCYPVRCLERTPQRRLMHAGKLLTMEWHAKEVVLPNVAGSRAGGCVVLARGILSRLRGMKRGNVRPDLAVIDDPQTDTSARSPAQIGKRLAMLAGAILNLAGPGKRIAGLMPCTVIQPGDVADQILDPKKHPEWHGLRTAMLHSLPANLAAWDRYYDVYRACLADAQPDFKPANAYYRIHRKELDRGAEAAWRARKEPGEVSAVQHAMNLRSRIGPEAFEAECQNAPQDLRTRDDLLTPDGLASRLIGLEPGTLPAKAQQLTAHVDVHDQILYWTAAGWESGFAGHVAAYGTWPEQPAQYFAQRDAPAKLSAMYPRTGKEGAVLAGLAALVDRLAAREFRREDGAVLRIGKLLIDARYDRDLVTSFCRRSPQAAILMPAMGYALPKGREWSGFFLGKEGGQTGFHWRIPPPKDGGRYVLVDTNWWKTLAWERLRVAPGDPGCWTVAGREARAHRLLFDHYTSEKPVWVVAKDLGRYEWELAPGRDNHWWDNLVGCAVAASMAGVQIPGMEPARRRRPPAERPALGS